MRFAFVAAALSLALSAEPVSAQVKTLDVAVEDAAGPWSSKDGTGFANDVVVAAYQAAGVQINLKVMPYARCKFLAKKGEIPVCFSVSPEPGMEKTLILSAGTLFTLQYDYYQNLSKPLEATRPSELARGSVVGIVNGYEYPEPVSKLSEQGVTFEVARDEQSNLKKLALGRIDAAIINHNEIKTVERMLEKAGVTGKVGFAFPAGQLKAYVGFSKKHPLGEQARKDFDRGFAIIKRNGTFDRITREWMRNMGGRPGG